MTNMGIYGTRYWNKIQGQNVAGSADALNAIGASGDDDTIAIHAIPTFSDNVNFTLGSGETVTVSGSCASALVISATPTIASLTIGTTGTPITLTNASHAITIFTTHAALTGTVRSAEINQVQTVEDASIINEVLYVNFDSAVSTGDWANAIVGRINFTAPGNANGGMAAAICSEISLMGAAQSGGSYYSLDVELDCPASFTCSANPALPVAFQKFGVWGDATAITSFETGGYLFHIDGLASPSSSALIFHTTGTVSATHGLRINIDGVDYDLLMKASTYA